jgi:hypothetical protein
MIERGRTTVNGSSMNPPPHMIDRKRTQDRVPSGKHGQHEGDTVYVPYVEAKET